ncbi:MAG: PKD domain-containing protein [Candidatus Daviesbacteria bacterium]|nr:PKD domain-containing protein [Candidatus Daviesbacteria bacterium]
MAEGNNKGTIVLLGLLVLGSSLYFLLRKKDNVISPGPLPGPCLENEIRNIQACPAPNENLVSTRERCADGIFVREVVTDCAANDHTECVNGRCELVAGAGQDSCDNDNQCMQCSFDIFPIGLAVRVICSVDGGTAPYTYEWDVGLGGGLIDGECDVFFLYPREGQYLIQLRVTDANGTVCLSQGVTPVLQQEITHRMAIVYSTDNNLILAGELARSFAGLYSGSRAGSTQPDLLRIRSVPILRTLELDYDIIVLFGNQCDWGVQRAPCAPNPNPDTGIWDFMGFDDLEIVPGNHQIQKRFLGAVCVYSVAGLTPADKFNAISCFVIQATGRNNDPCSIPCLGLSGNQPCTVVNC